MVSYMFVSMFKKTEAVGHAFWTQSPFMLRTCASYYAFFLHIFGYLCFLSLKWFSI